MSGKPADVFSVTVNFIIMILFAANMVATWMDPYSPFLYFNFIYLSLIFYTINCISWLENSSTFTAIRRSLQIHNRATPKVFKDPPPSYSSLGAEPPVTYSAEAEPIIPDSHSSHNGIAGRTLDSSSDGLPSYQNAFSTAVMEGKSDVFYV